MGRTWVDVALNDMRQPGFAGSYLGSYTRNSAPPTGRRANGNNSMQYERAGCVMGRYPNATAFTSTNPDFGELSWMSPATLADLAGRSWGESIMWNHIYCADPWKTAHTPGWIDNTRVVWWDWQFWVKKKSTGAWVLHQSSDSWSGVPIWPTFEVEDYTGTWEDMRTEASGYKSVRLRYDPSAPYAGQGAGYWAYHGFSGGVKFLSASGIDVNDVADCVVSAKVSLVVHSAALADDRDYARFAIAIGADWYPVPRVRIYPGLGTSTHKLVRAKWPQYQFAVFHTMTEPAFNATNGFPPVFAGAAETYDSGLVGPPDPGTPPPPNPAPAVGNWFPALFGGVGNWQAAVAPTLANSAPVWGRAVNLSAAANTPVSLLLAVESGYPAPTYSKVSGATWATVASNGQLTGTPTQVGDTTVVVRATNAAGSADATVQVSVLAEAVAPSILTTTIPAAVFNSQYQAPIEITGAEPIALTLQAGTLPTGLAVVGRSIVGTPTNSAQAGSIAITLRAANASGTDDQAFTLLYSASNLAPTITTAALAGGTTGIAYSQTLAKTGAAPITWAISAGALPAGLTLNASTGLISGTITATLGMYSFTVRASNVYGTSSRALSISVASPAVAEKQWSPWARWLRK